MARVLVVDDSKTDRALVGGLLERDGSFAAEFAESGEAALAQIEENPPAIVITDLVMPGMDGLELVEKLRDRFPYVPVILMTSEGSEDIAVRALRVGASSYVPKRVLGKDLSETAARVLAISGARRGQERLRECVTRSTYEFELASDDNLIAPLVRYLGESVSHVERCTDTIRMQISVAIEEALVNALHHGNLELDSRLRENDHETYYRLMRERSTSPPYSERKIYVSVDLSRQRAVFRIRDEGRGFDPSSIPDPTDEANLERASGRGLLLMKTFMTSVTHNPTGNEVTLVKET